MPTEEIIEPSEVAIGPSELRWHEGPDGGQRALIVVRGPLWRPKGPHGGQRALEASRGPSKVVRGPLKWP